MLDMPIRADEPRGRLYYRSELWCSWLSRLLYTQKVLGSNPSSSIFVLITYYCMQRKSSQASEDLQPQEVTPGLTHDHDDSDQSGPTNMDYISEKL